MKARKIAYFGGSFDPPHSGHRALVQAVLDEVGVEAFLLVPTGNASSYKKRALSAPAHRLAMSRLAFAAMPQVTVSEAEIHSSVPNYTVETLERLQAQARQAVDWHLVLGADQLAAIHTWRRYEELLNGVCIVLAGRALAPEQQVQLAANMARCKRLIRLQARVPTVSSTQLRAWAAQQLCGVQGGQDAALPTQPLLQTEVLRYIAAHRLYCDETATGT